MKFSSANMIPCCHVGEKRKKKKKHFYNTFRLKKKLKIAQHAFYTAGFCISFFFFFFLWEHSLIQSIKLRGHQKSSQIPRSRSLESSLKRCSPSRGPTKHRKGQKRGYRVLFICRFLLFFFFLFFNFNVHPDQF